MIDPGELRSDSANHGAPTSGTVGPHHASSMMSSAAPSFSAGVTGPDWTLYAWEPDA
jgi:hypothetical protein